MSAAKGLSAFPVMPPVDALGVIPAGYPDPENGMSLHQWYAGLAMQGLVASGEYRTATAAWIAQQADNIATAMLTQVGDKA